ncbi:MAG: hypothetical protein WD294_10775 [Phycisphaeraceae bacterium]
MVHLICPDCQAELEIDEAFKGSVCRCYTCGSLLSVPESRSEKPARAARPESPPGSDPDPSSDIPEAIAPASAPKPPPPTPAPQDPAPPQDPTDALAAAITGPPPEDDADDEPEDETEPWEDEPVAEEPADDEAEEDDPFADQKPERSPEPSLSDLTATTTTASPKRRTSKRRASKRRRANRRKPITLKNQIATVLALVLSIATLLAVLFFAMQSMQTEPEVTAQEIHEEELGTFVNPLLQGGPQYLGVPLAGRTALVIDHSGAMTNFVTFANQAAVLAVEAADERHELQVVAARESDLMVFPPELMSGADLSHNAVERRLDGLTAGGGFVLLDAVERAIVSEPEMIILTARLLPDAEQMQTILRRLEEAEVSLTVVLLDADEAEAVAAIRESGGNVLKVPGTRLRGWFDEYSRQR